MKITKLVYIMICLILIISYYFVVQSITHNKPQGVLELTISDAPFQAFGLYHIAQEQGFFQKQNLQINKRSFRFGKDALDDVALGNADLATVYETAYVKKVTEGDDLSIVSSLHKSRTATAIVAHKNKDINFIADLQNKSIGAVKGTNSEFLIYTILTTYNIPVTNVKIIFDSPENLEIMFKENKIDSVSIFNPNLDNIQSNFNDEQIVTFYSETYIENSVLAGKTERILEKKEAIKRFLRALMEAEKYVKENKYGAIQNVAKQLPNTPRDKIEKLWDYYELTLTLDNVLVEILNSQAHNLKIWQNATGTVIDFRDKILSEYLKEVSPESVSVF